MKKKIFQEEQRKQIEMIERANKKREEAIAAEQKRITL